jgi:hypothetical protein
MVKLSTAAVLLSLALQSGNYRTEVESFHKERTQAIGGDTGWAALTDLHWLENGRFSIGRAPSNAIRLNAPSSPEQLDADCDA